MAETSYPFDSGPGAAVSEAQWADMAKRWQSNGVIYGDGSALAVVATSGMVVAVGTGAAWFNGFFYRNGAAKNITIANNASGNPRIDSIVLNLDTTGNTLTAGIVPGTPATTPVAPTLNGLTQMLIANVAVANGAANIITGNITQQRSWISSDITLSFSPTFTAPGASYTVSAITGNADPDNNNYQFRIMPGNLCWINVNQLLTYSGTSGSAPTFCTLPFPPRYLEPVMSIMDNNPGYSVLSPVTATVAAYLPGYMNSGTANYTIGNAWFRVNGVYQMALC